MNDSITIHVDLGTRNTLATLTHQAISLSQALSENEGLDAYVKDVASLMGGLVCDIEEIHKGLFEPKTGDSPKT
ncbi:MAG: hypothetical protein Q7U82_12935 [Gammaproteobacteria bacterium]|nr:hypothetical protein [Gammaproteobacteria bacterium]